MSNELTLEQKFKINIDNFTKLLQALCDREYTEDTERRQELSMMLKLAKAYLDKIPNNELILMFIEKSKNYWLKIHHKDKNFFQTELIDIFSFIDGVGDLFRNIFAKLTKDIEDHIWKWINVLVRQATDYIQQNPEYKNRVPKFEEIYKFYH